MYLFRKISPNRIISATKQNLEYQTQLASHVETNRKPQLAVAALRFDQKSREFYK